MIFGAEERRQMLGWPFEGTKQKYMPAALRYLARTKRALPVINTGDIGRTDDDVAQPTARCNAIEER